MSDRGPTTRWLTPPQVAKLLGIDAGKVVAWIRRGELNASNVALDPRGKPRWRIAPEALQEFLLRRKAVAPPPPRPRRRKRAADVIEFYPA